MNVKIAQVAGLSALIAFGTIGAASAAVEYKTGWFSSVNGSPTPRNMTLTDWNNGTQTISVQQFDTMGGSRVLDQVRLQFFGDIDSTGNVTAGNTNITVSQYDVSLRMRLLPGSFAGPYTTLGTVGFIAQVNPSILSITPGLINANTALPVSALGVTATTAYAVQTPTSAFEGLGTVLYRLFTETRTISDISGGEFTQNLSTLARASVTLEYTYHEVDLIPEPATIGVLGLALTGLGVLRRRARKSAA